MRRHLKAIIAGTLILASAMGFYYFRGLSRALDLFRRQSVQPAKPFQPAAPLLSQAAASIPVKLYFPSLTVPGMLEEEVSEIKASELTQNRAKQIILKLIEGSTKNHGRTISEQTILKELFLTSDGTAIVDFSSDLQKNHAGGIECELQTIYSVVNSVVINNPSIKRVRFLIDDSEVETLTGHTDLSQAYVMDLNYIWTPSPSAAPTAPGQ
jgi:hypothetical protein